MLLYKSFYVCLFIIVSRLTVSNFLFCNLQASTFLEIILVCDVSHSCTLLGCRFGGNMGVPVGGGYIGNLGGAIPRYAVGIG